MRCSSLLVAECCWLSFICWWLQEAESTEEIEQPVVELSWIECLQAAGADDPHQAVQAFVPNTLIRTASSMGRRMQIDDHDLQKQLLETNQLNNQLREQLMNQHKEPARPVSNSTFIKPARPVTPPPRRPESCPPLGQAYLPKNMTSTLQWEEREDSTDFGGWDLSGSPQIYDLDSRATLKQ